MATVQVYRVKYSLEERILLLSMYLRLNGDHSEIFAEFGILFPNRPVSSKQTVYKLYRKFSRTGSVAEAPHSGRPSTATNERNMYTVAQAFVLCNRCLACIAEGDSQFENKR